MEEDELETSASTGKDGGRSKGSSQRHTRGQVRDEVREEVESLTEVISRLVGRSTLGQGAEWVAAEARPGLCACKPLLPPAGFNYIALA